MTTPPDLRPAAEQLAQLVRTVPEAQLSAPTPCADFALGDLLDHVGNFARGFTLAAVKDMNSPDKVPPSSASNLETGWRERIANDLTGLGLAWAKPDAWGGMTRIAGAEMPAEAAGMFALDELIVHGWDVARATRRSYEPDEPSLAALHGMLSELRASGGPPVAGLFETAVPVPETEPLLDRVVGLTGRHPGW